jgi:hypothetical protein
MRYTILLALALAATNIHAGQADPLRTAVFDLELVDTSLEGEMNGASEVESRRLAMLSERLRAALAASGRYELVDIAPVREEANQQNLQSCGGCDRRMAAELGADLAVTGFVQKVSNLILNINLYVRDVESGRLVEGYSADIRSNTDESWTRGLDWLLKNRLLVEEAPK